MVDQVKKLMKSYMPRNRIEIERKYFCSAEALGAVREALISEQFMKHGPFVLDEAFAEKEQTDIYFDTKDKILLNKKCTLRIRQIKGNYVCTIKLPVKSESFGGNSPTARREYEMEHTLTHASNLDEIRELPGELKNFVLRRLGDTGVTEEIFSSLHPILKIVNAREKGIVKKINSSFICEICLDKVKYIEPGKKEALDFQVEVELKSDYLTHVVLDRFTAELEKLMSENFEVTEKSKLERGLELLI